MFNCAICKVQGCSKGEKEQLPGICPTREGKIQEKARNLYKDEDKSIAYNAALVTEEGGGNITRIQETIEFIKKCDYKKIGLIFCIGLSKEAEIIEKIFESNDLDVIGVMCKNGGIPKSEIGIGEVVKENMTKKDIMCNPIGQALYLNEMKTDFNVILGLCVGHDTLAIKHSNAPVTVLAVKDRVLKHNPLAAIYLKENK
ncbi:hypothetical protein CLCY_1c03890 [Clostridium cylindrosporum DSM 605]|uniref:Metal-binding protein n=2 Tax=Clostridium cylindrosporum TaxID=1495 RepID=A0A0J8D4R6_CLOCY|nr:DUF1847 domain-containing protein [Clostridium cylindrosporum]KMT21155.1 hypothetical protein CLCY_1c03890 [Clostridium cylindrosporum DSM 605]